MKQVEVTILGQGYILGCPEGGEARLGAAVAAVDREMCAIRDAGKIKARDRIAVLAALNLAYQLAERPPAPGAGAGVGSAPGAAATGESTAPVQPGVTPDATDLGPLIARLDAALADGQLL
ncbi:MAG: cell division protein ZapA [Betaproteobacteria bacterium]|jgi:cell division protein ZapA